jgi:voltage-gated potassium channel
MFRSLRAMFRDPEGKVLLAAAILVLAIGTIVYMVLEGWSPIDSLYFSIVTLATIGFGDLHPTTTTAKVFTILYILSGLGIIAAFLSEIPKYRASSRRHWSDHGQREIHPEEAHRAGSRPAGPKDSGAEDRGSRDAESHDA